MTRFRHLNGVYTQQFNKNHGRDGPLFRGRFKSLVIERIDQCENVRHEILCIRNKFNEG